MTEINQFNPDTSYKFYFIRKGLLEGIKKHSHQLKGKMMDFGCGNKPYKSLFNVQEYIGVDYDWDGNLYKGGGTDVYYDGKTLPFPDNHFDSVFSSEVFEHIFNLDEILPEIRRTMKPNAKILITCPFVWNEHEVPMDYARYTQFALKHIFEKHGFQILESDKAGNAVTAIFQLIQECILPSRFRFITVRLFNLLGILANKLVKENKSFYLSNIVLAQKK